MAGLWHIKTTIMQKLNTFNTNRNWYRKMDELLTITYIHVQKVLPFWNTHNIHTHAWNKVIRFCIIFLCDLSHIPSDSFVYTIKKSVIILEVYLHNVNCSITEIIPPPLLRHQMITNWVFSFPSPFSFCLYSFLCLSQTLLIVLFLISL